MKLAIEPLLVFVGADGLQTEGLAIAAVRAKDLVDYIRSLPMRFTPDQVSTIAGMFRVTPPDSLEIPATCANAERVPDAGGAPKADDFAGMGTTPLVESLLCPRCGAHMVLRTARRGQNVGEAFYGCSNFPKCRHTRAA